MRDDFIETAKRVVDRLEALDKRKVVFGSSRHRHSFKPPMPSARVDEYERSCGITLPPSFRQYITKLGNGGAGPYYGILPLDLSDAAAAQAFPHKNKFVLPDDAPDEDFDEPLPGCVRISEYGCGIEVILIVSGASAGQIWWDARYESGVSPIEDEDGTRYHFDRWWLKLMEEHLDRFETILKFMRARTPHEEIHHRLEPGVLQLHVDETMLSIMDRDPSGTPLSSPDKPWGRACGLVNEHYDSWLDANTTATAEQDAAGS